MLPDSGAITSQDTEGHHDPRETTHDSHDSPTSTTRLRGGSAASGDQPAHGAGTDAGGLPGVAIPELAPLGPSFVQNRIPLADPPVREAGGASGKPRLSLPTPRRPDQRGGMALVCEELAATLLGQESPHERLAQALSTSLPGMSCLSVALVSNGGQTLRKQSLMEAGSLRRGAAPPVPVSLESAAWRSFTINKMVKGKDGVDGLTKARYGDWQSLHQKYGATAFVTVPLDVAAGVVGTITAAGGPKLNTRAVQMLAVRLGEVLLRRTTERLMKGATESLEKGEGSEAATRIVAAAPFSTARGDGMPAALDLRCYPDDLPIDLKAAGSPDGPVVDAAERTPPPLLVGISPFTSVSAAATDRVAASPRSDGGSLRISSLDQYQELKFYCLKCRKENCMDLPHWHWGQLVDNLCNGRRSSERAGSLATATAPAVPQPSAHSATSVASPSHAIASAGLSRMARLAALCARNDTDDIEMDMNRLSTRSSTRTSSTADLTHPVAQRAASGQLARISPRDLSESSITSSPGSSRTPSCTGTHGGTPRPSQMEDPMEDPAVPSSPPTPSSGRPPVAPDVNLRTQLPQSERISAQTAILAYTAGLRRRSAAQQSGLGLDAVQAAAAAARRKVATGSPDGADGVRAVSSYVDHLRRKSQDISMMNMDKLRLLRLGLLAPARGIAPPQGDSDLSTPSLKAGSVYEDETAREAVAAYKAARKQTLSNRGSNPPPPAPSSCHIGGHSTPGPAFSQHITQPAAPSESTRASTTRPVADKSAEGVQAARTMVSDYMASLQTRSITASQGRPGPGGDLYGADQTQLSTSSGDGARAVSTYLDGLRSRSMAARATRSGPGSHPMHGTPAAMAAAQAAAGVRSRPGHPHGPPANEASKPATPAVPPAPTGALAVKELSCSVRAASQRAQPSAQAQATVDEYMSSLRQHSQRVGQARSGGTGSSASRPDSSSNGPNTVVADYMRSLRRRSVAAAATEAARQSTGSSADLDEVLGGQQSPPSGSTRNESSTPGLPQLRQASERPASPQSLPQQPAVGRFSSMSADPVQKSQPQLSTEVPEAGQRDSLRMNEARSAVAAHMAALRQRSASMRQGQSMRELARGAPQQGSRLFSVAAPAGDGSGGDAASNLDQAAQAATGAVARSGSGKVIRSVAPLSTFSAASAGATAAAAASDAAQRAAAEREEDPAAMAEAQVNKPLDDPAAARAVVGSYMEQLRRRSSLMSGSSGYSGGGGGSGPGGGPPPRKPVAMSARAANMASSFAAMSLGGGGRGMPPAAAGLRAGSLRSGSLRAGSATAACMAAVRSGSGENDGDGRPDAQAAVASYMEGLQSRGTGVGTVPAGTSVRSSGSLRSGSLRLASVHLDPVAEMDEVASSPGQPESPLGGGEVDMTEGDKAAEAIADKSDADAHKVVATYIHSLRRASAAANEPPKRCGKSGVHMQMGEGGPSLRLTSQASTLSSSSSRAVSGVFTDAAASLRRASQSHLASRPPSVASSALCRPVVSVASGSGGGGVSGAHAPVEPAVDAGSPTGAVDSYMSALKQRAAQAAATLSANKTAVMSRQGVRGPSHAASEPNVVLALDAYMAGLKSRSAQAAVLRANSSMSSQLGAPSLRASSSLYTGSTPHAPSSLQAPSSISPGTASLRMDSSLGLDLRSIAASSLRFPSVGGNTEEAPTGGLRFRMTSLEPLEEGAGAEGVSASTSAEATTSTPVSPLSRSSNQVAAYSADLDRSAPASSRSSGEHCASERPEGGQAAGRPSPPGGPSVASQALSLRRKAIAMRASEVAEKTASPTSEAVSAPSGESTAPEGEAGPDAVARPVTEAVHPDPTAHTSAALSSESGSAHADLQRQDT